MVVGGLGALLWPKWASVKGLPDTYNTAVITNLPVAIHLVPIPIPDQLDLRGHLPSPQLPTTTLWPHVRQTAQRSPPDNNNNNIRLQEHKSHQQGFVGKFIMAIDNGQRCHGHRRGGGGEDILAGRCVGAGRGDLSIFR